MNQTEDEGDEDVGLPSELERMVAHEDQEMGPHQEETELVGRCMLDSGRRAE